MGPLTGYIVIVGGLCAMAVAITVSVWAVRIVRRAQRVLRAVASREIRIKTVEVRSAAEPMVPLMLEVPASQVGDMRPGRPVYDAAMEYANRERDGAGLLILPSDLVYDSIPIRQNLPRPDDGLLWACERHHDVGELCTVCGGSDCGKFFCYVMEK